LHIAYVNGCHNSLDGRDQIFRCLYCTIPRLFNYSLDHANKSFYRSANAIFGKVGRLASEEVTLQLIKSKCIPVLLYGLEACPLNKSDLHSLDFVINIFFMKLFRTSNIESSKLSVVVRNTSVLLYQHIMGQACPEI